MCPDGSQVGPDFVDRQTCAGTCCLPVERLHTWRQPHADVSVTAAPLHHLEHTARQRASAEHHRWRAGQQRGRRGCCGSWCQWRHMCSPWGGLLWLLGIMSSGGLVDGDSCQALTLCCPAGRGPCSGVPRDAGAQRQGAAAREHAAGVDGAAAPVSSSQRATEAVHCGAALARPRTHYQIL